MKISEENWYHYLLLVIPPLIWAGNLIVGRFIHTEIPAGMLNLCRWLLALLILLPYVIAKKELQIKLLIQHWKYFSVLSLAGITLFHTLMYTALKDIPATNAGIIITATPIFIVLFALVMGDTKFSLSGTAGIILAATGALTVLARGEFESILQFHFGIGEWLALLTAPCWAVYTVMLKRKPPEISWIMLLTIAALFGVLFQIPFALYDLLQGYRLVGSIPVVLSVLYTGIFPSIIAYICWNAGVHRIGAHQAGLFMYLTPVMSALLAVIFLGEDLAIYHFTGMALIIFGIFLAQNTKLTSK